MTTAASPTATPSSTVRKMFQSSHSHTSSSLQNDTSTSHVSSISGNSNNAPHNLSSSWASTPRGSRAASPLTIPVSVTNTNNALSKTDDETLIDPLELLSRLEPLPEPLHPSNCPLLCCFYGEFDNTVGPTVCFQSPEGFMSRDVDISSQEVEHILSDLFVRVKAQKLRHQQQLLLPKSSEDAKTTLGHKNGNNLPNDENHCTAQQQSIFDATSDHIISVNELADQIVSVSTHNIHLMTMSTSISDARYERNSLLFSVGFVLRRDEPINWSFRGPLSTIVSAFKTMELESQFLSTISKRKRMQTILESIVISLNSPNAEANLLLDESNLLNLKLFRPPRALAPRVPEYVVPILLIPEWQLQMFDWDLTINWIIPHIDGIKNARLIAQESEMDDEMCAACLRVLKHHSVIDFCDIFRYSNVYESTPLASSLLSSSTSTTTSVQQPMNDHPISSSTSCSSELLDLACFYSSKTCAEEDLGQFTPAAATAGGSVHTALATLSSSPIGLDLSQSESNTNKARRAILLGTLSSSPLKLSSSPLHRQHFQLGTSTNSLVAASFPPSQQTPLDPTGSYKSHSNNIMHPQKNILAKDRHQMLKGALAHLYSSFTRNLSFGELLLSKLEEEKKSSPDLLCTTDNGKDDINWEKCLEMIDHRRFITFGIIHGIIRRVHCFPKADLSSDATDGATSDEVTDPLPSPARINTREIYDTNSLATSLGQLSSSSPMYEDSDEMMAIDEAHEEDHTVTSKEKYPLVDLANKVAESMDGTKCDDELTCTFNLTLPELVELVETYTDQNVSFVYTSMQSA